MSAEGQAGADRRGEPRVPFDGSVRLRYRLFQQFLEENAANISTGGMFIRTIHPGEPGSELDFEIRLDDDFTLIQGRGEVAWVRRGDGGPEAEPGMGIRFVELPDDSRALVDKIVGERVAAGLVLFDLEDQAPAAEPAPAASRAVAAPLDPADGPIWELDRGGVTSGAAEPAGVPVAGPDNATVAAVPDHVPAAAVSEDAPAPRTPVAGSKPVGGLASLDPDRPASRAVAAPGPRAEPPAALRGPAVATGRRTSPTRLIVVAVMSALIGAGAVLTFYWIYVQPSIDALETRIDELAGGPGGPWRAPEKEPEAVAATVGEGADSAEAAAAVPAAGVRGEVVTALRGWAAAWSGQRVEDYLAYYAAGFEPPDGLDRAAWEEARRARIDAAALDPGGADPGPGRADGPDAAEVRFVQSYRSERYKDLVKKRLRMVREDGAWKIAAERAEP